MPGPWRRRDYVICLLTPIVVLGAGGALLAAFLPPGPIEVAAATVSAFNILSSRSDLCRVVVLLQIDVEFVLPTEEGIVCWGASRQDGPRG